MKLNFMSKPKRPDAARQLTPWLAGAMDQNRADHAALTKQLESWRADREKLKATWRAGDESSIASAPLTDSKIRFAEERLPAIDEAYVRLGDELRTLRGAAADLLLAGLDVFFDEETASRLLQEVWSRSNWGRFLGNDNGTGGVLFGLVDAPFMPMDHQLGTLGFAPTWRGYANQIATGEKALAKFRAENPQVVAAAEKAAAEQAA